jgi:hypothetical protein
VTASVHPNAVVSSVAFVVSSEDGSAPDDGGPVIASFGSWGPGTHDVSIRWDGRDEEGVRIPAGRYRLFATTTGQSYRNVSCLDGSTGGIEVNGGGDGAGLGVLVVPG